MSFEMKYSRNGDPIANKEVESQIASSSQQVESQQELPEPAQVESHNSEREADSTQESLTASQEDQRPSKPTPQESFNALKKKAQQMERERDEAIRKLQQQEYERLTAQHHQAKDQKPVAEEEADISIGDDDLAEGKHIHSLKRKVKRLEDALTQTKQISETNQIEARIKSHYGDFDSVVTKENLDALAAEEPEVHATIVATQDLYSKAVSAYKIIKKLGIHQEQFNEEKEMAKKNVAKPRPLTSISPQQGDSPLSKANAFANGLTDDLKKQLYKEMIDSRKNR